MLIRSTAIILILLLLWSCEEVVDLDIDFEPLVVVVSEIAPNRPARVTLNRSRPILSDLPTEYVTATEVTIENSRNGLFSLFLQEPTKDTLNPNLNIFPFYTSRLGIAESASNFELNVKIEGEAPISAITTIPERINIQSLNLIDFSKDTDPREDDKYNISVQIDFNHNANKSNSYHLIFYFIYSVEHEIETDTVIYNFIQTPEVNDLSTNIPYTFDFENGVLIKGNDISSGLQSLEANLSVQFDEERSPFNSELLVELRNTNIDYHNYHFNLTRQLSQRDSILSQAIIVPSNIHNGLGIFSGYNFDNQIIKLTE